MGLDQFAYLAKRKSTNKNIYLCDEQRTDLEIVDEDFFYWRKNRMLDYYTTMLFKKKAVRPEEKSSEFNCDFFKLEEEDILGYDELIEKYKEKTMIIPDELLLLCPIDTFYNEFYDEFDEDCDRTFIIAALKAIKSGYDVYYQAWW